jgi:hypothetical protein
MSELGQSRHFDRAPLASGLRRLADILKVSRHVSKVPNPDIAALPIIVHAGCLRCAKGASERKIEEGGDPMNQFGDISGCERILAAPKAINNRNPGPSCKARPEPNSYLST